MVNPRIIYASIAVSAEDGPYGKRPGVDQIAQGSRGFIEVTGIPGRRPVRRHSNLHLTAGMSPAQAVLIALLDREVTGVRQWVHTSLLESKTNGDGFSGVALSRRREIPKQGGVNHLIRIPTGVFEILMAARTLQRRAGSVRAFLYGAVGLEHLVNEPKFNDTGVRSDNRDELHAIINDRIRQEKPALGRLMNEIGVPCGPIYPVDQVRRDPQASFKIVGTQHHPKLGDIKLVGQAINLTVTHRALDEFRPRHGTYEHTDSILDDLCHSTDQISDTKPRDIIQRHIDLFERRKLLRNSIPKTS